MYPPESSFWLDANPGQGHLLAKYQRWFPGFDDKIISMYARGMSTREITGHLREMYGIDVSPDLISTVTDALLDQSCLGRCWLRNATTPSLNASFASPATMCPAPATS